MDAVVADFAAGAAEMLSPDAAPDHWDVIEGQGSLLHPSYAGVSLALLHGSQPDVIVVCHDPRRTDHARPSGLSAAERRGGDRAQPAPRRAHQSRRSAAAASRINTSRAVDEAEADGAARPRSRRGSACRSPIRSAAAPRFERLVDRLPRLMASERRGRPAWFQRFLLPGLAFKAVVIGGGYATGRELAEFFLPSGPWGGIAGDAAGDGAVQPGLHRHLPVRAGDRRRATIRASSRRCSARAGSRSRRSTCCSSS